jgi:hypothetical protein
MLNSTTKVLVFNFTKKVIGLVNSFFGACLRYTKEDREYELIAEWEYENQFPSRLRKPGHLTKDELIACN